jgi:hypothetical protein
MSETSLIRCLCLRCDGKLYTLNGWLLAHPKPDTTYFPPEALPRPERYEQLQLPGFEDRRS